MKLHEIVIIPDFDIHGLNLEKVQFDKSESIGKIDGKTVFKAPVNSNEFILYFSENKKLIAFIYCGIIDDYLVISRMWTHIQYRNTGYISALHRYVIDKMKIKIISDDKMTKIGLEIWKKLKYLYKSSVFIIDTTSDEIIEFESFKTLDKKYLTDERYRFLVDKKQSKFDNIGKNVLENYALDIGKTDFWNKIELKNI